MGAVDRKAFDTLVARLEPYAARRPRAYRARVALLVLGGYTYLVGLLVILVALAVAALWSARYASAAAVRLAIALVALSYAVASKLKGLRAIGRPALRTRGTPEPWTARSLIAWAAVLIALAEGAWLLYPPARALVLSLEETPAVRGYRLAAGVGCFSCHGPGGNGGTKNPGSEEGEVPAFGGQTQMMYVTGEEDLREYILDGAPRRKRDDADYRAKVESAALRMPSYRSFLSTSQVEDLVA